MISLRIKSRFPLGFSSVDKTCLSSLTVFVDTDKDTIADAVKDKFKDKGLFTTVYEKLEILMKIHK